MSDPTRTAATEGPEYLTRDGRGSAGSRAAQRWIVVADSPFLPASGGGDKEHAGFVATAMGEGLLAALVVPADTDPQRYHREDDIEAIIRMVQPHPVILTPRIRGLRAGLQPARPYVVGTRPPTRSLVGQLRSRAPDATGIVVFSYKSHYLGARLAHELGLPAVLRMHNAEGRYHRALAASATAPRSWAMWVEALRVGVDERRLGRASWLRGFADISVTDARARARHSRVPVRHVPAFALGPAQGSAASVPRVPAPRPTVVFLGALDVATNVEAVEWFATRVWPAILRDHPEALWQVVGRRPSERILRAIGAVANAELRRDVPDPGEYLRAAHVAVNPAVSGSGVNIKLLDYLVSAVPTVSTALGMQGLGVSADDHLLVADDPLAFAAAVSDLLEDPAQAQAMGSRGQAATRELLDVGRALDTLKDMLDTAGSGDPADETAGRGGFPSRAEAAAS